MLKRISRAALHRARALAGRFGYRPAPELVRCGIHPLAVPLAPDERKGWKPYPLFRGRTRNCSWFSCHASVLTGGNRPHPPHTHEEEELLLLLAGEADLVLPRRAESGDGERLRLRPGQFVYYPPLFPHTLEAVGDQPANYLMFKWSCRERGPAGDRLSFGHFEPAKPPVKEGRRNGFHSQVLFQGPTPYLRKLHCHATVLEPGGGYEPHVDRHDVAILMLEGECETLGQRLRPHGVAFYGAGESHGMRNPTDTNVYYVVFEFHGSYKPSAWTRMIGKLRS